MNSRTFHQSTIESVSIVVPLYNEEESIAQLYERLLPVIGELKATSRVELILVDDGSSDATFELLHQYFGDGAAGNCEILQHPRNRGIAAAMRTGFQAAKGQVVCTMDSDCSYAPEDMIGMIRLLDDSRADIVTASPYHPSVLTEESSRRLFLSRACSILYRWLVPQQLYCYTSFFRVCRREWAHPDLFVSDGFLGVTEYLLTAAYCGAAIVEHPTHLGTRKFGRSKMRTLQVIRQHLGLMARTLLLNVRLQMSAPAPLLARLRNDEYPLYTLNGHMEPLLNRLEYLGNFHLDPALTRKLHSRIEIRQHARAM